MRADWDGMNSGSGRGWEGEGKRDMCEIIIAVSVEMWWYCSGKYAKLREEKGDEMGQMVACLEWLVDGVRLAGVWCCAWLMR